MGFISSIASFFDVPQAFEAKSGVGNVPQHSAHDISKAVESAVTAADGQFVNSVVYACARVIAEGLALPEAFVRQTVGNGRKLAVNHPLFPLLNAAPNDRQTSYSFREFIGFHLALHGNAYVYIVRSPRTGEVLKLLPLDSGMISITVDNSRLFNPVQYFVFGQSVDAANIWHLKGPGWLTYEGLNTVGEAHSAISLANANETYGVNLFKNGARPGGIVAPKDGTALTPEQAQTIKEQWSEQHKGVGNAHKTLFLTGPVGYTPVFSVSDAGVALLMSKIIKAVLVIGAAIALVVFSGGIAGAIGFAAEGFALTAATLATITSAVVGLGLSLGLSAVTSLFQKTPNLSNSLASRLSMNEDTTAPRKIVFGHTAAGSDLRFKESWGSNNDRLSLVLALASHRINKIESVTLDTYLSWQNGVGITGSKSGGITAGQIAAGAITASELAAGAVTASKIGITGASLFPDGAVNDPAWWTTGPSFASGYQQPAGSWYVDKNTDPATVANKGGANSWVTAGVQGSTADIFLTSGAVGGVIPGEYYEFKSTMWNATPRNFLMQAEWWNASGSLISGSGVIQPPQTVSQKSFQVQAPVGAAYFRVYWQLQAGTAIGANQLASVGGITVRQCASGTLIVDGQITTSKLAAQAITADKIAAGTITGDRINSASSLPASLTISGTGYSLYSSVQATQAGMAAGANRVLMSEFGGGTITNGWTVYDNQNASLQAFGAATFNQQSYCDAYFVANASGQLGSVGTSAGFAVTAGERLSISVGIGGANLSNQYIDAVFYNSAGQNISQPQIASYGGSAPPWTTIGGFVTVPATAVRALILLYGVCNGGSGTGYRVQMSHPMVTGATSGQAILTPYAPGPDGSQPAATINAGTTQIDPGKITVSGSTTLSNWRAGGDNTKIDGGNIYANSIKSNSLTIGNRALTFVNLSMQVSADKTSISWSGFAVLYVDQNGTSTGIFGAAGSFTGSLGNTYYVYWSEGSAALGCTTDSSVGHRDDVVCVAVWAYGNPWIVQNEGGTIVNGAGIVSGTITANQIAANTIVGGNIAGGTITGDRIAANTLSVDKLAIGARGLATIGIFFNTDRNNTCTWTEGYVDWYDENFNRQVTHINGGSCTRTTNGTGCMYVWFDRSASASSQSLYSAETSPAGIMNNPNNYILAMYWGGTNLTVYTGGTIVDGDHITTNSMNANKIVAGTITTDRLVDNSITSWILASNPGPFQGGSSGGSGGGGSPVYCVADASHMPFGLRAGSIEAGDDLAVLDREGDGGWHVEPVRALDRATVPCARITSASGITLVVSLSTPITLRGGIVVDLRDAIGLEVPVMDGKGFRWERLVGIEHIGDQPVTKIDANNGTYAAGEKPGAFIFTHNKTIQQP